MHSTWSSSIDRSREDYDGLAKSGVDATALTGLCCFGADVGARMVELARRVDGLPSSVKSLGFEIWAACEVLCELAMVLTRARRNFRMAFFNAEALREIEDCVEICDEIFHEAARGVLVAYDRLKVVGPKDEKGKASDEKVYLSFDERTRWPLFQRRTGMMMEALMNAKLDLTLHLLVYWVAWEGESHRRSKSSILAELSLADRTTVISQLWSAKVRREQESASQKPTNLMLQSPLSRENSISPTSIFALSRSGTSTPLDSGISPTSTMSSNTSTDSALKRFGRRFARSSRRRLEAVGFMTPRPQEAEDVNPRDRATPDPFLRMNERTHSRETSQTRSGGSNNSSGSSERGVLRRAQSARPLLNTTQLSPSHYRHHHQLPAAATLPMTSSQSVMSPSSSLPGAAQSGAASLHAASAPPILPTSAQTFQGRFPPTPLLRAARSGTWFAGPTRAAKEGIVREWGALPPRPSAADAPEFQQQQQQRSHPEGGQLLPRGSGGDDGEGGEARELGRRLLFAQLAAMTPVWIVADLEEEEAASEMLVERWVRPGAVRRRMAQWEEITAGPAAAREEELQQRPVLGDEEVVMRFHFGQ